jgi:predicted nucleic acid-binding protein
MILADTDILSAWAKIDRLPLLYSLLRVSELHVTPGVLAEINHSFQLGREYAKVLFGLMDSGQIRIVSLTPEEMAYADGLSTTLGTGERESIAAAHLRKGAVLSNESRVAHACREHGVACLRTPDILRALWVEGIVSQEEVRQIISNLQVQDRMSFKPTTLEAILKDR